MFKVEKTDEVYQNGRYEFAIIIKTISIWISSESVFQQYMLFGMIQKEIFISIKQIKENITDGKIFEFS